MVILIHGDNIKASFTKLIELKHIFPGEKHTFDAKTKTQTDLQELLASSSLLSDQKLVQVDNFGLKFLNDLDVPPNTTLVLYAQQQLPKADVASLLKKFPKLQIEEFKVDPVVFKFVEAIYPGNRKALLSLWQSYIKTEEPEIAMAMLARQLRLLIAAKENKSGFDDFDTSSPWQKQKLLAQSSKFDLTKLLSLHEKLLAIDYKYKTGQSPLDLAAALELFLLSL